MRPPEHVDVCEFVARLGQFAVDPTKPSPDEVEHRAGDYAAYLCAELPADAFCGASFRYVISKCRFFPAYAELLEHLQAWWRENRPLLPALPSPTAAPHEPPSEQQVARVASAVNKCRAALTAALEEKRQAWSCQSRTVTSAEVTLTDTQLLAAYQAIAKSGGPGASAAAARVQTIERRLAAANVEVLSPRSRTKTAAKA